MFTEERFKRIEQRLTVIEAKLGKKLKGDDFHYELFPSFTVGNRLEALEGRFEQLLKHFGLCVSRPKPGGELIPCPEKEES